MTIDRYVEKQIEYAQLYPDLCSAFMHNAFGAVEWEITRITDTKEISRIYKKYNAEWFPAFEKINMKKLDFCS